MKQALEIAGSVLFLVIMIALFWLYLIVTPDQYSGECELLRQEMQEKGIIE